MKGTYAFDPVSGADLSEETHYIDSGIKLRAPIDESVDDSWTCDGALTSGELVSSCSALIAYFRRCRDRVRAPESIDSKAALAIRRCKAGSDAWDEWVWYATAERLARRGVDAVWMLAFCDPRCPRCSSRVRIEPAVGYPRIDCGANCGADSSDRSIEIYDRILDVYNAGFAGDDDEPIESLRIYDR